MVVSGLGGEDVRTPSSWFIELPNCSLTAERVDANRPLRDLTIDAVAEDRPRLEEVAPDPRSCAVPLLRWEPLFVPGAFGISSIICVVEDMEKGIVVAIGLVVDD